MINDLSVDFSGLELKTPFFNASGPLCTTLEELQALGQSNAGAILSKSCTLELRDGNQSPRYVDFEGGSINSMGLPNLGYKAYESFFSQLVRFEKPIFCSVSGLSISDNEIILKSLANHPHLNAVELNLSCPNVIGKPQIAYDPETAQKMIAMARRAFPGILGVKLPPYFDFSHFETMAKILSQSDIQFITCINSPGNGLVVDPVSETTLIHPKGGFGGIGGKGVKPFGLSNVRKFRELLPKSIQIIGVGGIFTGMDVFEYILCGADAVQIGTAFMQEGPEIYKRIETELNDLMIHKSYSKLEDFRNQLKIVEAK
tara:strand:- start:2022 stop:2966 length:945 start_codon:yes stop_codon:yes gene_type:complete